MAQSVDGSTVAAVFQTWTQASAPVEAVQAVAMDGKALGSTLQDCYGQQQDFVMVVSACVQSWAGGIGQITSATGCETDSRFTDTPGLFSVLLRAWAISAFRNAGYDSLTKALRLFKHDLPSLLSFL